MSLFRNCKNSKKCDGLIPNDPQSCWILLYQWLPQLLLRACNFTLDTSLLFYDWIQVCVFIPTRSVQGWDIPRIVVSSNLFIFSLCWPYNLKAFQLLMLADLHPRRLRVDHLWPMWPLHCNQDQLSWYCPAIFPFHFLLQLLLILPWRTYWVFKIIESLPPPPVPSPQYCTQIW